MNGLRGELAGRGLDGFFSVFGPDNQYLTGFLTSFSEVSAGIIIGLEGAFFLTDSRYTEQAEEQVRGYGIEQIQGDLLAACGEKLKALGLGKVAFDPRGMTVDELDRLQGAFDGELIAVKDLVSGFRKIKSEDELAIIESASRLAEGVLADLLSEIREGVTEQELAARFEFEFRRRGATGAAFDTIALFGSRSSLPHGTPGGRRLEQGDVVLLDFGCRYHGYCSDLTRTFAYGTMPGPWFLEIYELALAAQGRALAAIHAGAACRDVDAAARAVIAEGGHGERFGHGLGHGVGIEIHEGPRVNPRSDEVLEAGMVVTVEPGIYLPGLGGVRIEDLVAVTDDGYRLLSHTSKELKVLGI